MKRSEGQIFHHSKVKNTPYRSPNSLSNLIKEPFENRRLPKYDLFNCSEFPIERAEFYKCTRQELPGPEPSYVFSDPDIENSNPKHASLISIIDNAKSSFCALVRFTSTRAKSVFKTGADRENIYQVGTLEGGEAPSMYFSSPTNSMDSLTTLDSSENVPQVYFNSPPSSPCHSFSSVVAEVSPLSHYMDSSMELANTNSRIQHNKREHSHTTGSPLRHKSDPCCNEPTRSPLRRKSDPCCNSGQLMKF